MQRVTRSQRQVEDGRIVGERAVKARSIDSVHLSMHTWNLTPCMRGSVYVGQGQELLRLDARRPELSACVGFSLCWLAVPCRLPTLTPTFLGAGVLLFWAGVLLGRGGTGGWFREGEPT